MARLAPRKNLEANFIEAGFFSATGYDIPQNANTLEHSHREIYTALCGAANRLTRQQLRIFANMFDGIDENGDSLRKG